MVSGLLEVSPIPVLLLAQALNGVLLPWVAVFLLFLLAVNDRRLMAPMDRPSWWLFGRPTVDASNLIKDKNADAIGVTSRLLGL